MNYSCISITYNMILWEENIHFFSVELQTSKFNYWFCFVTQAKKLEVIPACVSSENSHSIHSIQFSSMLSSAFSPQCLVFPALWSNCPLLYCMSFTLISFGLQFGYHLFIIGSSCLTIRYRTADASFIFLSPCHPALFFWIALFPILQYYILVYFVVGSLGTRIKAPLGLGLFFKLKILKA
jgi:hypothetical protein